MFHVNHQEISRIPIRPHEVISCVVSGYEWHNSAMSLYWTHYGSCASVMTCKVMQYGIDCMSLVPSSKSVLSLL